MFVLGFILKRRVLYPVVRLSDVVQRLASRDYAVETPQFTQVDEIGDMARAIRIFRENGPARQQLEQQRDADWAIRELLARMTQRLQGCETIEDVIKVAELFAPNIAPTIPGNCIFWIPIPADALRGAVAGARRGDDALSPDDCWAIRRGLSHPPVQGEPDITCYHLPEAHAGQSLCVPLIARAKPSGC